MTDSDRMPPVVSVCIANYNGIGLIDACIESAYRQDCSIPVEIIVHDDASTDGSVEHIRTRYPDVNLIQSAENVGFCVANNRMAVVAKGKYLLLLNNDATLLPDALQTLHTEAVRLGRPAILGLPQYDAETGALLDIGSLLDPFLNPVPNLNPDRNDVGLVMGACLWIDKRLWDDLSGFPEWFGSIGEDPYLCCRARLAGPFPDRTGHPEPFGAPLTFHYSEPRPMNSRFSGLLTSNTGSLAPGRLKLALLVDDYAIGLAKGTIDLVLVGAIDDKNVTDLVKTTESYIHRKIRGLLLAVQEYSRLQERLATRLRMVLRVPRVGQEQGTDPALRGARTIP